jgi:hypothetical protein
MELIALDDAVQIRELAQHGRALLRVLVENRERFGVRRLSEKEAAAINDWRIKVKVMEFWDGAAKSLIEAIPEAQSGMAGHKPSEIAPFIAALTALIDWMAGPPSTI